MLAIFLVLALVFAVPRIKRLPGLPRELLFEEVPDSTLTAAQAGHLSRLDAAFATLHYRPLFNIRVPNLSNPNLTRFYTSDVDPALLLTSLLRVRVQGADAQNEDYVEMITRYRDGTVLTTLNSSVATPFDTPPGRVVQRFPGMDPLRLKARHDQGAVPLVVREPLWHARAEILQRWQESHREWCEHQVQVGRLRYEPSTASYRLSRSVALRGIVKFLNPLGREVTARRLAAAVLFGAILPTAGLLAFQAAPPSTWPDLAARLHLPAALVANAILVALLAVAGAVAGLVFGQRHFVGALVLGLAPAMVLARVSLRAPFLALAIVETSAALASGWVNQRRRLLT